MKLSDITTPEFIVCQADVTTKKQVLELMSRRISEADSRIKYSDLLDALLQREKLGSTAIGQSAAIPHARLGSIKQAICIALTLKQPVDFDPDEGKMVDIIFGLIVPDKTEQEHLDILAEIAEKLKRAEYCEQLREADSTTQLYRAVLGKENIEL